MAFMLPILVGMLISRTILDNLPRNIHRQQVIRRLLHINFYLGDDAMNP